MLRVLRVARRGAMKARVQAGAQLDSIVVSAPESVRTQLRRLTTKERVRVCAALRPGLIDDPAAATKLALRALARRWQALQSLVAYWAGRTQEAVRFAQSGAEFAKRASNTTAVWLPMNEARAWAALGNAEQSRATITRAEEAWATVQEDDLDQIGGICTFSRARQLYYAR